MAPVAKASSEYLKCHSEAGRKNGRTNDAIARPISSPSPWSSGCRQLAWKGWDRGRGSRLQGPVQSGPGSCHWHTRRHRMLYQQRRSWYLNEVRKRSRDIFDNLRPLWRERELSRRVASRSCSRASYSFVISCSKPSAIGYCCPLWLCRRTKGKRPSGFLYFGLQLVKPGSRPNLLQSAALGSAS